jgi:formate/nitrite transporter
MPKDIAEGMINLGRTKAELPIISELLLGFLAGSYIAFGGFLAIRTAGNLPEQFGSLQKLLFGAVFPLGLILVIIAGAELVTGNMMTQPIAYFDKKISLKNLLKNWTFVYLGNFIGALFFAYFLAYKTGIVMEAVKVGGVSKAFPWAVYAVKIANAKVNLSWGEAFLRGIGCNWLVALAVWMAYSADDIIGKIFAIWWPIMGFVAMGFEHSVANMFFIPLGIYVGQDPIYINFVNSAEGVLLSAPTLKADWFTFIVNNLIPVTLGNIIGAGIFVAAIYWYVYRK